MRERNKKADCGRENSRNAPLRRFTKIFFAASLIFLCLVVGIHSGLLIFMMTYHWNAVLIVHVVVFYWLGVAAALTWFARWQIRKNYEKPVRIISQATEEVAKGNFSIVLPLIHTPEKYDAFDYMIQNVNRMISELKSIETLKTDFISNVSHEMKTPLAVIQNYAELLRASGSDAEKRDEYAACIEAAAIRMSGLVSDILKLNRLENQRITPDMERYDVCRQLVDCILQFENRWEEKGLDMDTDLEDSAFVLADRSFLELVWNNLMSNAIKFTEPGGKIIVRERTENGKVVVTVSDTGCGIDSESIQHIFDKFYQGDTSHATEGNGLGLALVQRVIALSEGIIDVESKPGKGSIFTVTLPSA